MKFDNINLRRFFAKIQKDIAPHLARGELTEEKQAALGLTALFLAAHAGMPIDEAHKFVVDEGEDFGIDGIFFNSVTQVLFIVQSKFRTNQNKTISQGEILKFKNGIEKLLQGKIHGANEKFIEAYNSIVHALDDINTKIHICVVCTSTKDLEDNVSEILETFCLDQNEVDAIFQYSYTKFDQLYQMARFFSPESDTDPEISLYSYGSVTSPYKAYFGYVEGNAVASWVGKFGNSLFEQNVRFTLQNTDVNESIYETIEKDPQKFWYFNNGITAIASEAQPVPSDTDPKKVKTKSLSIVNGAQTAGMLARAAQEGLDLSDVRVQFRVISLRGAAPGLDEDVTRANNTQNELNPLDFVSLDPKQELLKSELARLGFEYIYKRGSESSSTLPKIEVKDAAVALACAAQDISISVQAKRYVSGLWSNIKSPPYTTIFHEQLTGRELLDTWRAYGWCEQAIRQIRGGMDREAALILTHGDRFIAHCVFTRIRRENLSLEDETVVTEIAGQVAAQLPTVFRKQVTSYPATAFKNQKTQEMLKDALLAS